MQSELAHGGDVAPARERAVFEGTHASRRYSDSTTPRGSPAAMIPTLPGLPQARTPQPPTTPPSRRRPATATPPSRRRHATGGSARWPLPGESPSQDGGRPMTTSRLRPLAGLGHRHRPATAGATQSTVYLSKLKVKPLKHPRASPQLALLCGANFGGGHLEREPSDRPPSAWAWQLIETGQYAAAVANLDAAIELQPALPGLYSSRALAHLELGHVEKAVADCETSISIAPDDIEGYLRLASMCDTVGQRKRAIHGLQLGLVRFPDHEEMTRVLKQLESAEDGGHNSSRLLTTAGHDEESVSTTFVDLIVRGRALFLNLPQNEREDIYRALKAGDSLVARMVRDACAVTLQCALRLHQARQRWRALGHQGAPGRAVAPVLRAAAGCDEAVLLADARDLLVRLPSGERDLLATSAASGSKISMVFEASAITIQCALRSHRSRRSAASRKRDLGGQVVSSQGGPEGNIEGLPGRASGADILCLDEEDSEEGSRPVTPPLPSDDGSRPATPPHPPTGDFQDSSNVTTEPQSTHVKAAQGEKTEIQETAVSVSWISVQHEAGMEGMLTQPAQAKGLATEGVAVAESQGLAAESDSEHELQHDADYEDDEFEPVQETEIQEAEACNGQTKVSDKVAATHESGASEYENEGYENEGYDEFEDVDEPVAASSPRAEDDDEEGEVDHDDDDMGDTTSAYGKGSRTNSAFSRGNTAMSGATTVPRTRKGTRHGSPLRTGESDGGASPYRASSAHHPKRLYLDSVGGEIMRSPGGRDMDWELPSDQRDVDKWALCSSVFPASGVTSFPCLDPVVRPRTALAVPDDASHQIESEDGGESCKDQKDKLDPRYRTRINLFLGISEWPPRPPTPTTPAPPAVSRFVKTFYQILECGLHDKQVKWTKEGTAFVLRDPIGFEREVLPKYLPVSQRTRSGIKKANGFDLSTVLQALRQHGFRKVDTADSDSLEFFHRYFLGGVPDNLHKIKVSKAARLVDGSLPLVLPRPWTPPPMPGQSLPLNHPLHHMTCPELHPLPHGADYSRSADYEGIARPGTTAKRAMPQIKELTLQKEKMRRELEDAKTTAKAGKVTGIFSKLMKDMRSNDAGTQKKMRKLRKTKAAADEVKKEEILVGPDPGLYAPKIGLRVKLSQAGRENKELREDEHAEIGMILEIEPDGRLCQVKWHAGDEEWCCTGFSSKYYLQAFIASEEVEGANSRLWLKAASFAPSWNLIDGVWKMNRLKSTVKVTATDLRRDSASDKVLKTVREEVRKYHVKLRLEEQRKAEAEKAAKKQQKQKRKAPKRVEGAGDNAPKIDNIEYVGTFMQQYGKLSRVIQEGQLSALSMVLRNAFKDMDKMPSGNVSVDHLCMQVGSMELHKDKKTINDAVSHISFGRDSLTLDEFLDLMYHLLSKDTRKTVLQRKLPLKRTDSFRKSAAASLSRTHSGSSAISTPVSRTASNESSKHGSPNGFPPPVNRSGASPTAPESGKSASATILSSAFAAAVTAVADAGMPSNSPLVI